MGASPASRLAFLALRLPSSGILASRHGSRAWEGEEDGKPARERWNGTARQEPAKTPLTDL